MDKIRLYKFHAFIGVLFIMVTVIAIMIIIVVLNPREFWFFVLPISMCVSGLWYLIAIGEFHPLYITETEVSFRGQAIKWEDVRITAYLPSNRTGRRYVYYLLFSREYLKGDMAKKEVKKGFYVSIYQRSIEEILKHYNYEIRILGGPFVDEAPLNAGKKYNKIINEHNEKFKGSRS